MVLESFESSRPITLLKFCVGSPFLEEFPLMEVWNGWTFLTSTGLMVPIGRPISWLTVIVGGVEVTPPIRNGEVNMEGIMKVFPHRRIVPSVSFRSTAAGSQKTCAPLRAFSMTITFEAIFWSACAVPLLPENPSAIGGLISGMMTGTVRLINNFC